MGAGLTPFLAPLPQLSHKLHKKRFHLLQVGILKPTQLALPVCICVRHALLLLRKRSRLSIILESRNGRSQGWRMVKDEARQSPVTFLEYRSTRRVAEALRSHPRRSQRVLEVYSLLALNLVR
jgi:hypothetical protein